MLVPRLYWLQTQTARKFTNFRGTHDPTNLDTDCALCYLYYMAHKLTLLRLFNRAPAIFNRQRVRPWLSLKSKLSAPSATPEGSAGNVKRFLQQYGFFLTPGNGLYIGYYSPVIPCASSEDPYIRIDVVLRRANARTANKLPR